MKLQSLVQQIEAAHLTPVTRVASHVLGATYQVDVRIQEGDKTRLQSYRGALIRIHRAGLRSTVTLRKLSKGIGVERVFPVVSPDIASFERKPMKTKSERR